MLVSSAKYISDIIFGRSLKYKRKSNDPSIQPCGTLCLTGSHLEKNLMELFFNKTLWYLLFKYDWISLLALPEILQNSMSDNNIL